MIWLQLAIATLWLLSTGASLLFVGWLVYRRLTKQGLNR